MKETFEAVYERGVLRPLRPLGAREGQRLRVSIEPEPGEVDRIPCDLTDLVGRLTWRGDPVDEQRKLRDEW